MKAILFSISIFLGSVAHGADIVRVPHVVTDDESDDDSEFSLAECFDAYKNSSLSCLSIINHFGISEENLMGIQDEVQSFYRKSESLLDRLDAETFNRMSDLQNSINNKLYSHCNRIDLDFYRNTIIDDLNHIMSLVIVFFKDDNEFNQS